MLRRSCQEKCTYLLGSREKLGSGVPWVTLVSWHCSLGCASTDLYSYKMHLYLPLSWPSPGIGLLKEQAVVMISSLGQCRVEGFERAFKRATKALCVCLNCGEKALGYQMRRRNLQKCISSRHSFMRSFIAQRWGCGLVWGLQGHWPLSGQ